MKSKIILAIVLFSAISLLSARNTSLKKVKTKADNTWNGGYDVSILIACGSSTNFEEKAKGVLYAPKVITPQTQGEKLGLYVQGANPTGDLPDFMTKIESGATLAYRFCKNAKYTNPSGGNKYIEVECKSENISNPSQSKSCKVRVNLPYKTIGWYIDDNEGCRIKDAFNNFSQQHQNAIVEAKTATANASSTYITTKVASSDKSSKESQIAKLDAEIKELQAKFATLDAALKTKNEAYNTAKQASLTAKQKVDEIDGIIAQKSSTEEQAKSTLEKVKTENQAELKKILDQCAATKTNIKNKWNDNISKLKALAPNRATNLDAATTNFEAFNNDGVVTSLGAVYPK